MAFLGSHMKLHKEKESVAEPKSSHTRRARHETVSERIHEQSITKGSSRLRQLRPVQIEG